jgi:uncharacterized protein (TIGR02001 family)
LFLLVRVSAESINKYLTFRALSQALSPGTAPANTPWLKAYLIYINSFQQTKGKSAMKKLILSAAILAAFASSASAQSAAPASPHTFTGNLTLATDYRFRGISQTFRQPAIQGGFDYSHSSGFYLGNWNSNVSGVQFANGGSIEMDFYGGYKFELAKDLTADIGFLYYYYPGSSIGTTGTKYDNAEIYVGAAYKWFSAKYSHGTTDFFGLNSTTSGVYAFTALPARGGSRGSGYLDLNATFEVADKTNLSFHVGRQWVKNYGELNYTDYKIGISREFPWATVSLAAITTNADRNYWRVANAAGSAKDLGTATAVLSVSKTF